MNRRFQLHLKLHSGLPTTIANTRDPLCLMRTILPLAKSFHFGHGCRLKRKTQLWLSCVLVRRRD